MPMPSGPKRRRHVASISSAICAKGATYTHRPPGRVVSMRTMANSAQMVLPEPVGAATRQLSSEWKSVEKVCVWIGLKWVKASS